MPPAVWVPECFCVLCCYPCRRAGLERPVRPYPSLHPAFSEDFPGMAVLTAARFSAFNSTVCRLPRSLCPPPATPSVRAEPPDQVCDCFPAFQSSADCVRRPRGAHLGMAAAIARPYLLWPTGQHRATSASKEREQGDVDDHGQTFARFHAWYLPSTLISLCKPRFHPMQKECHDAHLEQMF